MIWCGVEYNRMNCPNDSEMCCAECGDREYCDNCCSTADSVFNGHAKCENEVREEE